jgi:excinuclease UvrABC ATPase subunit
LITGGHTVLCVTHEPLLMEAAFKRFELGPGGGTKGGYLVG